MNPIRNALRWRAMAHFFVWNPFAWPLVGSGVVALLALFADRRRTGRRRIDRVGFMPWGTISLAAIGATLILAALAIKAGSG